MLDTRPEGGNIQVFYIVPVATMDYKRVFSAELTSCKVGVLVAKSMRANTDFAGASRGVLQNCHLCR